MLRHTLFAPTGDVISCIQRTILTKIPESILNWDGVWKIDLGADPTVFVLGIPSLPFVFFLPFILSPFWEGSSRLHQNLASQKKSSIQSISDFAIYRVGIAMGQIMYDY